MLVYSAADSREMGEQGFAKRLLQFRCCARGRGYGGDGHNSKYER